MSTKGTMTDAEWLDDVVLQNYSRVKRTAYHVAIGHGTASPEHWAEDMTQEVFLRLSARMYEQDLRAHPNITGWLIRTLNNVIGSEWQKRSSLEIPMARVWEQAREPSYELTEEEDPFPPGLTDAERDILYRCRYLGYSQSEVAASLGISHAACRKRLQRAEEKCKKYLASSS